MGERAIIVWVSALLGCAWGVLIFSALPDHAAVVAIAGAAVVTGITYLERWASRAVVAAACVTYGVAVIAPAAFTPLHLSLLPWVASALDVVLFAQALLVIFYALRDYRNRWHDAAQEERNAQLQVHNNLQAREHFLSLASEELRAPVCNLLREFQQIADGLKSAGTRPTTPHVENAAGLMMDLLTAIDSILDVSLKKSEVKSPAMQQAWTQAWRLNIINPFRVPQQDPASLQVTAWERDFATRMLKIQIRMLVCCYTLPAMALQTGDTAAAVQAFIAVTVVIAGAGVTVVAVDYVALQPLVTCTLVWLGSCVVLLVVFPILPTHDPLHMVLLVVLIAGHAVYQARHMTYLIAAWLALEIFIWVMPANFNPFAMEQSARFGVMLSAACCLFTTIPLVTWSLMFKERHRQWYAAQRRALTDVAASMRAREQFLVVAAHELRTPATALHVQLKSVQRRFAETGLDATLQQRRAVAVESATASLERLVELLDRILDVLRMSETPFELHRQVADLRDVVRQAVADLQRTQAVNIEMRLSDNAAIGAWDAKRIKMLVKQLLSNAQKYGQGKPVTIAVDAANNTAELRVVDHGIGVSPADQARIFKRFERAVSERNYGGLGLGLWMCRQIADAHGGNIAFSSVQGKGSTVTVRLPLHGNMATRRNPSCRRDFLARDQA